MKTVELGHLSKEMSALLDQARAEDVVVRLCDGSAFLLTAIDDFDCEVAAIRRNQKLMEFLDKRAADASPPIPLQDMKQRLGL